MMVICPDHQGPGIPLRIESDFYLCVKDVVFRRRKKEHRRRVVDCAVKRINEPVGILAGMDCELVAGLDLPADGRVLPLEVTRHNIDGWLLTERRGQEHENWNQMCSRLNPTHAEPPPPPILAIVSNWQPTIRGSQSCPIRGQLSTPSPFPAKALIAE